MAVPTTTMAVRYDGNGSTSTAYAIPFPFLNASHIYAAVSEDGVEDPVLLSASDYSVTRLVDGSGGALVTNSAVTAPGTITIFRNVPLTQPTAFQRQGPFPAKTAETAFDRVLMQVQQLNRRLNEIEGLPNDGDFVHVPNGDPDSALPVLTWADATARGSVKPQRAGQLGVERDTATVWIAQSSTVGDWEEFRPRQEGKLVIGVVSDAGNPGSYQTAAAARLTEWGVDVVLFAGDGNYNGAANYNSDWAAFGSFITAAKAFPALGNHDVDFAGWETRHAAKFPYLPGNKRYYSVTLRGGLVEVFVLNSGFNSIRDLVEPDGNEVGSTQHAWFVEAATASRARWKIAVFHHPPITLAGGESQTAEEMAWPELAHMDLICCGHSHLLEVLRWSDTMLINTSAITQSPRTATATLQGATSGTDYPLWASDEFRGLGRIIATGQRLEIEIWRHDGALLHVRSSDDFSPQPAVREQWRVLTGVVGVKEGEFVGTLSAPTMLRRVMVSVKEAGSIPMPWTLYADGVEAASGILPAGDTWGLGSSIIPLEMLPRGARLTIDAGDPYGESTDAIGLDVTIIAGRHN